MSVPLRASGARPPGRDQANPGDHPVEVDRTSEPPWRQRTEKSAHVEDRVITLPDGTSHSISLFARGGALGIATLTDTGEVAFTALPRVRTHRQAGKVGYRWHNDYRLPAHPRWRHPLHAAPRRRRRPQNPVQPHREHPNHPTDGPGLQSAPPADATTPNPTTESSTTPSGSAEPTPLATSDSCSTCSPKP